MNNLSGSSGKGMHLLLFAILAILVQLPLLPYKKFQSDDYWFIGHGVMEDDPVTCTVMEAFLGDWLVGARNTGGWYRPLPRLMLYLCDRVAGPDNPWFYHLMNIVLHAGSAVLVVLLVQALIHRPAPEEKGLFAPSPIALLAGLLFLVYPPSTGAVSWVASCTDVLAVHFLLWAVVIPFLPIAVWVRCLGVIVATVLSIMGKESGYFTAIMVMVVQGAFVLPTSMREIRLNGRLLSALCTIPAAGMMLLLRFHLLGGLGGYGEQFDQRSNEASFRWLGEFLRQSSLIDNSIAIGAALVLAAILLAGQLGTITANIRLDGRNIRLMAVGMALVLVAMLPVLNLPLIVIENDRYLYLTGIGWALVYTSIIWLAYTGVGKLLPMWKGIVVLLLFGFVVEWHQRNLAWMRASQKAEQLLAESERLLRPHQGKRMVVVFQNMDRHKFEKDVMHIHEGAKMLPWSQICWGIVRRTRGDLLPIWGFMPQHLEEPPEVILYISHQFEFDQTVYTVSDTHIANARMPNQRMIEFPSKKLVEDDGDKSVYYQWAYFQLIADSKFNPFLSMNYREYVAENQTTPSIATDHLIHIGRITGDRLNSPAFFPQGKKETKMVWGKVILHRLEK